MAIHIIYDFKGKEENKEISLKAVTDSPVIKIERSMLQTLKSILGIGPRIDYTELIKRGAIIIDVRSKPEFSGGHINSSVNIPVDQLINSLSKLKDKNQCIICCCASGSRSAIAKRILISSGYKTVYNAGNWIKLQNKL